MPASLEKLVRNLSTDLKKFREVSKIFKSEDLKYVTRKGVYPYEYTNSWEKLEETQLPPINAFYSALTKTNISQNEYTHTKSVWYRFNFKNLGEMTYNQ